MRGALDNPPAWKDLPRRVLGQPGLTVLARNGNAVTYSNPKQAREKAAQLRAAGHPVYATGYRPFYVVLKKGDESGCGCPPRIRCEGSTRHPACTACEWCKSDRPATCLNPKEGADALHA